MNKSSTYIQKLILLFLVLSAVIFLLQYFPWYYFLPPLSLTFGLLIYRITGEKPQLLSGLQKSDENQNKSGSGILVKWLLNAVGFIYDLIVWTIFGAYVFYSMLLDFVLVIKTIIYWLIHAIFWIFSPPFIFLYKIFVHYVGHWNWWIYKLSFRNIKTSANTNFFRIAFFGAFTSLFIVMMFLGVGLFINMTSITVIGIVFALLPVIWSFSEISFLRNSKNAGADFTKVKAGFISGNIALRSVLFYVSIFLILVLVEIAFNLFGWIPEAGFIVIGLAININTLISLVLLFLLVILLYAVFIIPPYIVTESHKNNLHGSINLLGIIGRKFLRIYSVIIPSAFFAVIVSVIPALFLYLSVILTLNIKNGILDTRINDLQEIQQTKQGNEAYRNLKNIRMLKIYREFPGNMFTEFAGIKEINSRIGSAKKNIDVATQDNSSIEVQYRSGLDSLNSRLARQRTINPEDSITRVIVSGLEEKIRIREKTYTAWTKWRSEYIERSNIDLKNLKSLLIQLPLVFFLFSLWVSFFGGIVFAVIIAYLGNVYFELYGLKEDGKPLYVNEILLQQQKENRNQPLLGFTLLGILLLIIFIWVRFV